MQTLSWLIRTIAQVLGVELGTPKSIFVKVWRQKKTKNKKNPRTKHQKKKQKKTKTNEKAQLVLLKLRNYPVVSSDQAILDITVHIDP